MRGSATIRRDLRARLLLSVILTIALVLAGLTAGFNLVLRDRLTATAASVAAGRASGELSALRVLRGQIVLPEAPDARSPDASVWVLQGARMLEAPQSAAVSERGVAALAARAPASEEIKGAGLRLDAVPVIAGGRTLGAVVAGVSLTPYQQTARTALIASIALAFAALVAVGLAANWLIRGALRPVARMTRLAEDWSTHDPERRFLQGPARDEFTQLAATLDRLLERLASSLRHEQQLSAELSHELRTPLANIAAQAQYALRHTSQTGEGHEALEQILASTRRMTTTLDTLIAAARAQLDPQRTTSDAYAAARAAATGCASLTVGRGLEMSVSASGEDVRVSVENPLVERILAPLIENACRHAIRQIRVMARREGPVVRVTVEDDGPGVPPEEVESIFEPGWRSRRASVGTIEAQGAGLGLALARRLARTAGGEVRAEAGCDGGCFTVELPAATA